MPTDLAVDSGAPQRKLLESASGDTAGMLYTLYINALLFVVLILFFEANRYMKQIYLKRLKMKFEISQRVPPAPPRYIFGWVSSVLSVSDPEFLYMVGLDGYMLIRYIAICFKVSLFYSFCGMVILAPIYGTAGGGFVEWSKYTLANVPDGEEGTQLWVPAIFSYLFSFYFCYLMQAEYENFVDKRVRYLIQGDPDTPPQTYYTAMIEHIPPSLRSAPKLRAFFDKLFPGDIYAVEVSLDLHELDSLVATRGKIRDKLEKSIAIYNATGKRPMTWTSAAYFKSFMGVDADETMEETQLNNVIEYAGEGPFGFTEMDAVEHYTYLLKVLNNLVTSKQKEYFEKQQKLDQLDEARLRKQNPRSRAEFLGHFVLDKTKDAFGGMAKMATDEISKHTSTLKISVGDAVGHATSRIRSNSGNSFKASGEAPEQAEKVADLLRNSEGRRTTASPFHRDEGNMRDTFSSGDAEYVMHSGLDIIEQEEDSDIADSADKYFDDVAEEKQPSGFMAEFINVIKRGGVFLGVAAKAANEGAKGVANEGLHAAKIVSGGALRGVLEATRAVELLTLGAFYHTSSTAFVTFNSRVSKAISYQMLLSHKYFLMTVQSAPNPKDIIPANVSIPESQIIARRRIADGTLILGALFWSFVVASINGFSNLDKIAEDVSWLQAYSGTALYEIFNEYLAVLVLLILLVLLPLIFDIIARNYEGLKTESEIQNSIMVRYFYYQLANVFVSVGSGTIFNSLNEIIKSPERLAAILGENLPQVSIYFANLVITRSLLGLPIEMLRFWPLLSILGVKSCSDRKKMTRRELRTGVFYDPPMWYGWCYPQVMMVLMILVTYSTIAPFLMPICALFFGFCYMMYKYQLLYVFINEYQSGGFMWYAVFNRSMVALLCGVLTIVGYLGLRKTYYSGPFYVTIPLPFIIVFFWHKCNKKYNKPSKALSLEKAVELDHVNAKRKKYGYSIPHASFNASLYRQPSLNEGEQQPEPYRTAAASQVHQQAAAARRSSIKAEVTEQLGAMESGQGRPIPKSTPGVSPPFRPPTIVETDLEEEDNRDLEETIEEFLGEGSHGVPLPKQSPSRIGTTREASNDGFDVVSPPESEKSPIVQLSRPSMSSYGSANANVELDPESILVGSADSHGEGQDDPNGSN